MYQFKRIGPYNVRELRRLDKKTAEEVLVSAEWSEDRIRSTSQRKDNAFEETILFLKILLKLFNDQKHSRNPEVINCLAVVATEEYFTHLCILLQNLQAIFESDTQTKVAVLENIIDFLEHVNSRLPSSSLYSFGLCCHLLSVTASFPRDVEADIQHMLSDVKEKATTVKKSISDLAVKPKVKTDNPNQQRSRKPPNDFRKIQILPTYDDINNEPFLRKILKKGAFDDLEHYLDVHFRLLREDCINQLRSGISEYIMSKQLDQQKEVRKLQDAKLYKNVMIIKKAASIDGPVYTLRLDENHVGRIRWEKSKRLLYGSLLCLSKDNFQTLFFAIITESDHDTIRRKCTIQVNIQREKGFSDIPVGVQLVMVESSAYFEAYRHVLKCLQNIKEDDLPFANYLIDCDSEVDTPKYLRKNDTIEYDLLPVIDKSKIYAAKANSRGRNYFLRQTVVKRKRNIRILEDDFWPSAEELHLDNSQYHAYKSALTKEFVIIQGPPGTGKTYVGLQIAKTLLHNESKWQTGNTDVIEDERTHPMLIVCFTNHALDQFMEGIINFMDEGNRREWEPHVVRVGGRCSNENVEKLSLKYKRRFFRSRRFDHEKYTEQLISLHYRINRIKWNISLAQRNILNEEILHEDVPATQVFIRPKPVQQKNRNESSVLIDWLQINSYVMESVFTKYENAKMQSAEFNVTQKKYQQEENIFIENESEQVKHERQIEEDDFETDYKFEENGISFELILENLIRNQEFDEEFETLLCSELDIVKNKFWNILPMSETEVKQNLPNIRKMRIEDRWRMYRYFVNTYCEKQTKALEELKRNYDVLYGEYNVEKQRADKEILCAAKVIAMTTSGAARYQEVLQEVQPKIIIVEEAAEVLEAHIISALNSKCDHLILIGDHKQLEPKPAVYDLGEKYNLSLSMFERMIKNNLPFDCLQRQHRMRPEISQLVRNIYPKLEDNENVKTYKSILGIEKDVFFISHNNAELHTEESRSYSNEFEAKYIKRLTKYLLQQGYNASQITVLTPYSGQMFCIRDQMPRREFEGVRISILDNYQGEENDIILLSLVRSNKSRTIGFLFKENRVCVALSRAKKGLYVIGDFDMIRVAWRKCTTWDDVIEKMEKAETIGRGLPLQCQNHPDQRIKAAHPDDFDKAPEGGCLKPCRFIRICDHECSLCCHIYDKEHTSIPCKSRCLKLCERQHECKRQCHFSTPCFCKVQVKKDLPCGHEANIPCYMPPENFQCQTIVNRILKCGHNVDLKCHEDYTSYKCKRRVSRTLPKCGHEVEMFCHENPETFRCLKDVIDRRKDCNHEYTRKCYQTADIYEKKSKCREMIEKTFTKCGHKIEIECYVLLSDINCKTVVSTSFACHHQNIDVPCYRIDETSCHSVCKKACKMGHLCMDLCHYPTACRCDVIVKKKLPSCSRSHTKKMKCHEDPARVICEEWIKVTLSKCGHEKNMQCFEDQDKVQCFVKTDKTLKCGHIQKLECVVDACSVTCNQMVEKTLPCGHLKRLECQKSINDSSVICRKEVNKKLMCGHHKTLPCSKNEFDEDVKCKTEVEKLLSCGHKVKVECSTRPTAIKCKVLTTKKLSCTHMTQAECYKQISEIKCTEKIAKILPKCGHSVVSECYIDPNKIKCETVVEKEMPICLHKMSLKCFESVAGKKCTETVSVLYYDCRHFNTIPCYIKQNVELGFPDKGKYPDCKVLVKKELKCGHQIQVKCSAQDLPMCKENCIRSLMCGHKCSGTCTKCTSGLIHTDCSKRCDRLLFCGHECKSPSCGKCPHCSEKCPFECTHNACQHPCYLLCANCSKPCDWKCVHFSCEKRCHEVCSRPRCNAKCLNKLHCGHNCMGLCGDPCPELCGVCNPGEMEKIGISSVEIPTVRLVVLQECKHVFSVSELDRHIDSETNLLATKRCPRCHECIRNHPRYNSVLKKHVQLVNVVKNLNYTISRKIESSCFPILSADKELCMTYLKKIGTFLAVKERQIREMNEELLEITNERLEIAKSLVNVDNRIESQTCLDIFYLLALLSATWKLITVMFSTENVVEHLSSDEEAGVSPIVRINEVISHLRGTLMKIGMNSEDQVRRGLRKLDSIEWSLSIRDKTWIQEADQYPRLTYYVDVHEDSWSLCDRGHPFCSFNGEQQCLTCTGVENFKPQLCQQAMNVDAKGTVDIYEKQGDRPKQSNKQKAARTHDDINQDNGSLFAGPFSNRGKPQFKGKWGRGRGRGSNRPTDSNEPGYVDSIQPEIFTSRMRSRSRKPRGNDALHVTDTDHNERQNSTIRGGGRKRHSRHRGQGNSRGRGKD